MGDGRSKYIVFFEGGGWCYNLENCHLRSFNDFGSSRHYPTCLPLTEMKYYISSDPVRNPLMWNWNIIRVKYCDATSYAGDTIIYHNNRNLYFKGKANRDATIRHLLDSGMKEATDVVIAGCSAGGTTYIDIYLFDYLDIY